MTTVDGQATIVTGAASGIGLACVNWLLARGHRVSAVDLAPTPHYAVGEPGEDRLLRLQADVTSEGNGATRPRSHRARQLQHHPVRR
jgi:NAD(P)-dependent dehydrogenase (short-subunit alcohol dehydrogenase family)